MKNGGLITAIFHIEIIRFEDKETDNGLFQGIDQTICIIALSVLSTLQIR